MMPMGRSTWTLQQESRSTHLVLPLIHLPIFGYIIIGTSWLFCSAVTLMPSRRSHSLIQRIGCTGHTHPQWLQAVVEQAETLAHTSNLFHSVPQVRKFCHKPTNQDQSNLVPILSTIYL